jgi:hypothetical protein
MIMGSIDWKAARQDAKAVSALIPDGDYPFECIKAEARLSNGGSPQVVADFLCLNDRYSKRTVRNWFTVSIDSPIALDILFRHLKVFGMDEAYFAKGDGPEMEDIADRLLGQKVNCVVRTSPYNGEDRNKIVAFKKFSGIAAGSKSPAGTASKKAAPAPAPRPAAKRAAPTVAPEGDDEPPF